MANKSICSVPGCGKPQTYTTLKLCVMHYSRRTQYGIPDDAPVRHSNASIRSFLSNIMSIETDDCVIWPFSRNFAGYPVSKSLRKNFGTVLVHRAVCIQHNGVPPSPSMHAAHSCGMGMSGCVNKRHLSWKTPAENNQDKVTHGTSSKGTKNFNAILDDATVLDIIRLDTEGASAKEIAGRFNVSRATVYAVVNGRTWSHLTGRRIQHKPRT